MSVLIEVEAAAREQMEHDLSVQDAISSLFNVEKGVMNSDLETLKIELEAGVPHKVGKECKPAIKGFSFEDDHLMNGNWLKEKNPDAILLFFRILAICHTTIPELENCSIIFDRPSNDGKMYEEDTRKHLNEYGEAGLRTLALAYKKLEESEYLAWNDEFQKAKTTVGQNREALLEDISDVMENHLILVGATAVEDKLQKGRQVELMWRKLRCLMFNSDKRRRGTVASVFVKIVSGGVGGETKKKALEMLSPRGRIRGKLRFSNLYTFSCLRPSVLETEGPHTPRGPGFSRVVHYNQPDLKRAEKHPSNYISTKKYNVVTFLPMAIFEQYRRVPICTSSWLRFFRSPLLLLHSLP
ncbi:hypothetical protein Sjap_015411 [Stephania japonica]|uniref:P-type ATPase N-terminal domain-containing protein n=1 Tax=Stephania japonica TaxID=461633 RepID=A0AAP0IJ27_9MAGN